MSNMDILSILKRHEIRTIDDLDNYAEIRRISRWHALAQLVGEDAADRIWGALAVKCAKRETIP